MGTVLREGVVNGFLVDDLLLDTGCSKTIVQRDLVGEEQWLEQESTIIQCAYGDAIAYPLAAMELEIQGKPVLVNAAVSDTLPQSVLVGTDVPGMLEMLQMRQSTKEGKKLLQKALAVMTRSCARGQPTDVDTSEKQAVVQGNPHETIEPKLDGAVSDNVVGAFTEFNFDDQFFPQDQVSKPKLTRSQKCQNRHEHAKEHVKSAGLDIPVGQFCELQESDPSLENSEREVVREVALNKMVCGIISGHLSQIVDTQSTNCSFLYSVAKRCFSLPIQFH